MIYTYIYIFFRHRSDETVIVILLFGMKGALISIDTGQMEALSGLRQTGLDL